MTVEIVIALFALIHFIWCLFEVFCHFNFYYCIQIIPYAILINILSYLNIKKSDVCVQTNFQQTHTKVETLTDAFACGDTERLVFETANSAQPTLGDCEHKYLQHPNNQFLDNYYDLSSQSTNSFLTQITSHQAPLLLYQGGNEEHPEIDPLSSEVEEPEPIEIFQNSKEILSLLDNPSDDLPSQAEGTNPFLTEITSHQVPLLLYQDENEERPEIDPLSSEVEEPEPIEIFQNSKEILSLLDNPSNDLPSQAEGTNPFLTEITSHQVPLLLYQGENEERPEIDPLCFEVEEPELIEIFQNSKKTFSLLDSPCPQDFTINPFLVTNSFALKSTNPFKGSLNENTNIFSGAPEEPKNCLLDASVSQKNDGISPGVSRPKLSLKRTANTAMSWIKSRFSVGRSPRYQKLK
ncbi:hypothetical protein AVEN_239760-1 [Araneus ventricosus]|uniref:Uncharacterized protein n=1 Tax=Araneus ventricosus TaxID=182803 RepID=A0A4Y2IGV1_ARAVE|nr:hypothetical protein AVEN_239760-1 [Araneus ventricosus]